MDQATLVTMLQGFLSNETLVRKEAEAKFNEAKENDPNSLVITLLQELSEGQVVERRVQAAVALRTLFRSLILGDNDNTWKRIRPEVKEGFKTEILRLVEAESVASVKRSIGDTVSDVGGVLYANGEWPELPKAVGALSGCDNNENSTIGLNILTDLVPRLSETISQDIGPLATLTQRRLEVGSPMNKVAAVGTIAKIVGSLDRSSWKPFQGAIPNIMRCMAQLVVDDSAVASNMLQQLCEMADADSEIFKPCIGTVLEELIKIARNTEIESDCRVLAVECLLSCVESKPKMCTKVPGFLKMMITALFECMLTIEEEWETIPSFLDGSPDEENGTPFDAGESGIDRLACALTGEVVMPEMFPLVGEYLQHGEWHYKFAAIMAISQTAEYLPEDSLDTQLAEIVGMLLVQLQDQSHRVRFAACQAIGQISLDHQPQLQRTMSEQILPPLVAAMNDPVARVQAHAITAFVNFAERVPRKDLLPQVPQLMEMFLARLKTDWQPPRDNTESDETAAKRLHLIREQCITAVAVVAGVIMEMFVPYYSQVVPLTMYIVESAVKPDERRIRGKALECLSIIALAVGYELFKPDVPATMLALFALIEQQEDTDETMKDYAYEACRRMVTVMGKDFSTYLPQALPLIYKKLQFQIEEASEELQEGYTLVSISDNHWKTIKTSVIEDLEETLVLIQAIIKILGEKYGPAVESTVEKIMPLLNVEFSDYVKRGAADTMADLLVAARESGVAQVNIALWLQTVTSSIFKGVVDSSYDVEDMTADMKSFARCLVAGGPDVLTGEQVFVICNKVLELMKLSARRRQELAEAKVNPELDEEDVENVAEEEQREQWFRSTLLDTFGALMKNHPKVFVEVASAICTDFIRGHINATAPEDRALALFVSTDILEHLGVFGKDMWPEFVERMISSVVDPDPVVRQAACYGCMLMVKIPEFSDDLVAQAVKNLNQVIVHPKAQVKNNRSPTDNAIAALMAVVSKRPAILGASLQEQVDVLIQKLPLRADEEEGIRVHADLLETLRDINSPYWGVNKQNTGAILKILGAVYETDMTSEATDGKIKDLVNAMGREIVRAAVSSVQLTAVEQKGLDRMFDA